MRHEEELKRIQLQYLKEQELQKKMMTTQPPVSEPQRASFQIPQVSQENAVPSQPMQVHRDMTDQENGPMTSAGLRYLTQNAVLSTRPPVVDQENQPMNIAPPPRQPMQNMMPMEQSQPADNNPAVSYSQKPQQGAPTPEEKHRRTVDKAQQQLQELRQQMHNESIHCHAGQNKEQPGHDQQPLAANHEREHTA